MNDPRFETNQERVDRMDADGEIDHSPIFPSYWTDAQKAEALVGRDQAVADATVQALNKAGLIRSLPTTGVVKRVARNEAGQIVSIIEESVTLSDAS